MLNQKIAYATSKYYILSFCVAHFFQSFRRVLWEFLPASCRETAFFRGGGLLFGGFRSSISDSDSDNGSSRSSSSLYRRLLRRRFFRTQQHRPLQQQHTTTHTITMTTTVPMPYGVISIPCSIGHSSQPLESPPTSPSLPATPSLIVVVGAVGTAGKFWGSMSHSFSFVRPITSQSYLVCFGDSTSFLLISELPMKRFRYFYYFFF